MTNIPSAITPPKGPPGRSAITSARAATRAPRMRRFSKWGDANFGSVDEAVADWNERVWRAGLIDA